MTGVQFPTGSGNFSLHHPVQSSSGAYQGSYPIGNGGSFLAITQLGHEIDHLPPSNAEVKNAWSYISTLRYVFMAWRLVKHRDNFTFTFLFDESGRNSAITPAVNWLK